MKETKVYVDELPVNCEKCKYYTQFDNGMGCMITQELRPMDKQDNYTQLDCPLVDIKTHDRELVKEVCEKISIELENETGIYCEIRQCNSPHYQGDYVWFNYVKFRKLAEKLQKEFEK